MGKHGQHKEKSKGAIYGIHWCGGRLRQHGGEAVCDKCHRIVVISPKPVQIIR